MIKLGTRISGRASALMFGIAAITAVAACGDNGVTPPDAAPDAPPAPAVLTMTPMTSSFGSVTVGTTSSTASFTITNTGGSPSGTVTPIITGTNAGDFTATNGCATLAPLGTCTVTVSFKPTSQGGKTANLVASASPGGSVMANLDGSGVAIGNLTINPGSQSFGTQTVGVAVVNNDKTFTITNGGGTASGALTVTAAGSDPGEFSKTADNCSGQMIAAAGTCTLTIRFAPLSSGSKSAHFDIVGNPGGSLQAAVSGIAVNAAAISVTPSVQNFGSVIVGGAPTSIVFTVTNTGGVTTGALANSISGDPVAFTIANSSCTGATLIGGGTCNITVNLNGVTAGAKNGSLDVTGAPGGSDSSLLSGQVNNPGSIVSAPGNIPFGPITVSASSAAQTITVTNTGGSATGALSTALGGANAADFNIVNGGNGCQGAVLAPMGSAGNTCTISVLFHPLTAGPNKAGSVTITGAPGGIAVTTLSGDGITPSNLVFNPLSKDFGSVTTGNMSATQTFTITNTGGQTSAAIVPALGGTDASEFMIMNTTCAGTLAPLASCDVVALFKPTTVGAKTAAINVTGGSAALTGDGISPAQIQANPTNLTFAGNTLVGTSALTQSFTVTNNGSSTTGTLAITITGLNAGDYSQTNNCTTLIANATCQVTVTFTPTAAGARVATVNVTGAPGGTVGVALAGTGQRKLEIITPNINPFDFGSVPIVGFGPCRQLTVRNNSASSVNLTVTLAPNFTTPQDFDTCAQAPGGNNTFDANKYCVTGLVLLAGQSCTMGVDASPDMPGAITAFVKFTIGASVAPADSTQEDFNALGQTNSLVITPCTGGNCTSANTPSFEYGNVNVGTTVTQVFTLLNQTMATTGILETRLLGSFTTFHIIQDNCAGTTLAVNATCTVSVIFQPTGTGGSVTNTLRITDMMTLPVSQAERDIHGTGIVPATIQGNGGGGVPAFNTVNGAFNFGPIFVGEVSAPAAGHTFVISNGSTSVNTGAITVALAGAGFSVQTGAAGDCVSGTTILGSIAGPNVALTCNVRVRYAPTVVHAGTVIDHATLTITGAPGGTAGVANNIVGLSVSTISVAATGALNFGNVVIGATHDEPFSMTNNSNHAVTFGSGTLAPGSEFTVVNVVGCAALAPAATCTFSVRFAPVGMPTVQRGPITLTMNATDGIATLTNIFGTAQSVANLVIAPTSGDFGSVLSGTGSSVLNFTLTNLGFQTATGIAVSIPNANGNYSQTNTCGATLAQNVSCNIAVTFAPPLANTGVLTATLTVGSTLGGAPTAALTGTGIANGQVTVTPATHDFGVAAIGEQSAQQVFTLLNTSAGTTANLTISVPTNFVVDNAGVAAPLCGATLAPIATCNFGVRLAPNSAGSKSGQAAITGTTYAAMLGIGLSNALVTGLADNNFGTVPVASFGGPRSYIITNGNVGPTGVLTVALGGANPGEFALFLDFCSGFSLAPGGQCTFQAFFTPHTLTGFGPKTATLNVTSNAVGPNGIAPNSGIALTANLSGSGANAADITISPTTSQADGNRAVGKLDAAPTVFTITNAVGSASTGFLDFTSTVPTGANSGTDFVYTTMGLVNPCDTAGTAGAGTKLAAGASCQVGIFFHPSVSGASSFTFTVHENDGITPDTVTGTVTGTGTEQLTGPPAPIALTANANTTLTFTNNASVATIPLEEDGTFLGTQVSVITDNCIGVILPAGGTCTVIVRYLPDGLNGPTGAKFGVRSKVLLSNPPYGTSGLTAFSFACDPIGAYCTFTP